MNIQVRVLSRNAQAEIKALRAQIAQLEGQLAAANKTAAAGAATGIGSARGTKNLGKWGNQLQWTGRQLQYNWTLPILLAAGAATKFELDNEKAFTRVRKVYGDTEAASKQFMKQNHNLTQSMATQKATRVFNEELNALKVTFGQMSSYYGVAQKDVLEIAGAWAQAGKSGKALAEDVSLTMQAMLIGDMDATKATEALISIQAQYGLSSAGLAKTLAYLNAVENQTAIDMPGLIVGFQKTAGVAREAGIDTRHLAAMLASLVPAAGSAANAGQALKTIITRLLSPTEEAAQVMNAMGLQVRSSTWQSATAMERLRMTSEKFAHGMTNSQKLVAATVLGSRWQVNKFLILMRDINKESGRYSKALDATSSKSKAFAIEQKELNAILNSSPQRLKIIWETLKNGMADSIQPMIPYILYLANLVRSLVTWFTHLSPPTQKFLLIMLLMLAAVGPVVRYFGSLNTLLYEMSRPIKWLIRGFGLLFTSTVIAADGTIWLQKGLIASALAALAWPFKKIAAGFGAVGGALMFMSRLLGINAALGNAWMIAWFNIRVAWFILWNTMLGAVVTFGKRFIAVLLAGSIKDALFGFAFMMYRTAGAVTRIWAAMGTALIRLTVIIQAELAAIWALFSEGIVAIYTAMQLALARITATGGRVLTTLTARLQATLVAIWAFGQRAIAATVVAGRAAILGAWAAMQVAMAMLSTKFWTFLIRAWIVGMTALIRITAAARAIVTIMAALGPAIMAALANPWTWAILAILAVVAIFHKQIAHVWNNIVKYFHNSNNALVRSIISAWNLLPQGVQNALSAVIRVVSNAAKQVYEWMSYLNPFAKHSPSLVESTKKGMGEVAKHHKTVKNTGDAYKSAHKDVAAFSNKAVTSPVGGGKRDPNYGPTFEDGSNIWGKRATGEGSKNVDKLSAAISRQQKVVDAWQSRVDKANAVLDKAQKKLDALQKVADKWSDKLSDAQQRLSDFSSAPLVGMQAMNDKIHANDMAQKHLQWQMMQMTKVTGTLDDVKGKLDAINGAQELLRGEQGDLRAAGAGSDILAGYDAQIKALDETKSSYNTNFTALQKMQDQLTALQSKADELDLQKSLKFDDLTYQIEKASQTMKEMPFGQIMKGIRAAKSDIQLYTGKLNSANAAVARQQKVVDGLTAARDRLSDSLSREQKQLEKLKRAHSEASKAAHIKKPPKGAKPYVSPGLQNFRDAAKGSFPVQPGVSEMRKDWKSQADDITKFGNQFAKRSAKMFQGLSPFAPIKKAWKDFKAWLSAEWKTLSAGFRDFFSKAFAGVGMGNAGKKFSAAWDQIRGAMSAFGKWIKKWAKRLWALFGPDIMKIVHEIRKAFGRMMDAIGPELRKFGPLMKPLGKALKYLWEVAKPVLGFLVGAILLVVKVLTSMLANAIGPVIDIITSALKGLIQIVRGILKIFIAIFTGDFGMLWDGVKDIFKGLVGGIIGILKGLVNLANGLLKGFVDGIVNFFKWLWNVLVGHSIIPDIVNGIIHYFKMLGHIAKWIYNHTIQPIVHWFKWLWKKVKAIASFFWKGLKIEWAGLKKAGKWIWDHSLGAVWHKFRDLWKKHVKPALKAWWSGVKAEWAALRKVAKWVWDHVLEPVFNGYKNLWKKHVKPALGDWWNNIKKVWNSLTGLGSWVKKHVMDPVVTKIKNAWTHIRDWLRNSKDMLLGPVKGIVNSVVHAINTMIKGLNRISNVLPGISFHIEYIPKLAAGDEIPKQARRVGSGFKTSGARAIVGEGKANYPEFVIPTDPTYRQRATSLLSQAASKIGMKQENFRSGAWGDSKDFANGLQPVGQSGVPLFGIGGLITSGWDSVKHMAKGAAGWIKGNIKKLATAPFRVFKAAAKKILSGVHWPYARGIGNQALNKVMDWVGLADADLYKKAKAVKGQKAKDAAAKAAKAGGGKWSGNLSKDARVRKAQVFAKGQVGKPYIWGGVGPGGYDCSGFMSALTNIIRGHSPYSRVGSTASFPWGGFSGGKGTFTIGSTPSFAGSGVGHMAGTLGGMPVESYGGHGPSVSHRNAYSSGFSTHAHLTGLRNGAIVRRRAGGVLARIGEGSQDEAVTPLPRGWRNGLISSTENTKRELHFHGDLSFPNITDPNDAATFIENLENLAKD